MDNLPRLMRHQQQRHFALPGRALPRRLSHWLPCLLVLLCLGAFAPKPTQGGGLFGLVGVPSVDIDGYDWLGDLYLEHTLKVLSTTEEQPQPVINAVFVEDGLWIISGQLQQQGFLYPSIRARVSDEQGQIIYDGLWTEQELSPPLATGMVGHHVLFTIDTGIRFYFESIAVKGLPPEITQRVESFFYPTNLLLNLNSNRFYTRARGMNGLQNIVTRLRSLGYRDARIADQSARINRKTGAVDFEAAIEAGDMYFVTERLIEPQNPELAATILKDTPLVIELPADQALTPDWMQTQVQQIRNEYYARGYPEVQITVNLENVEPSASAQSPASDAPQGDPEDDPATPRTPATAATSTDTQATAAGTVATTQGKKYTRVIIEVEAGPQVRIGSIGFEGEYGTRQSVLKQQLTIAPGDELNRNQIEESRSRLSALGIFRSIDIEYTEVDADTWDVTYKMSMKQRTSVSLIMGVGTFDIVRGGFLIEQNNLFGLAHNQRLRAVQSVRATDITYRYGIPQIFGNDLDFYAQGNYLFREQISFNRQEYGAAAGVQHFFKPLRTTLNLQYSLEQLSARNRSFVVAPGPTEATVSALTLKASFSNVDNPIFPSKGWTAHGSSEFAIRGLGGQVDYQRLDMSIAYHTPLNDMGLIFHAGFRHGVITTQGNAVDEIPVNRRFFMGGENTVRGYRRDQATPKDAAGNEIGAVSYMLWQVELEQRLTESFSVVTFLDTLGNAENISQYPFNQVVMSLGIGISYRTFVGPLRLEYGYNVKKRPGDPNGAVQVSVGFPF